MGAKFKAGDRVRLIVRKGAGPFYAAVDSVGPGGDMWVKHAPELSAIRTTQDAWEHAPLKVNATNPTRHGVELKPRQLVLVTTALAQLGVAFECATRSNAGLTNVSVHDSRAHLLDEIVKVMEERSARA